METKICSKCGEEKDKIFFSNDKKRKDGLDCWCKDCCRIYKIYYRSGHRLELCKKQQEYINRNKETRKVYSLEYRKNNKEKIAIENKKYQKNNKEKIRIKRREWQRKQYKINPRYRLVSTTSALMRIRLKYRLLSKGKKSTFDILPYTIDQLMQRLEVNFQIGMTWNNYSKWHIDHKKPDSLFDYKSIDDQSFKDCWSLANLQPLWAKDNLQKSNNF